MKQTRKPWLGILGVLAALMGVFTLGATFPVHASGGGLEAWDEAPTTDTDGDGIIDLEDNCSLIPNPTQCNGLLPIIRDR